MKIQYVAEDGTTFDSEVECMNHETYAVFGSDARFLDVVESILEPLVNFDSQSNKCIYFESSFNKTNVAITLAKNFYTLMQAFDEIKNELSQKPLTAAKKARK